MKSVGGRSGPRGRGEFLKVEHSQHAVATMASVDLMHLVQRENYKILVVSADLCKILEECTVYILKNLFHNITEITSGRVLNGELYVERFQKFRSSAFIYRLFHEDFSSLIGTQS